MSNDQKPKCGPEERTAEFGEDIIEFSKGLSKNVITNPLIGQNFKSLFFLKFF
jgi:hypothetical protein